MDDVDAAEPIPALPRSSASVEQTLLGNCATSNKKCCVAAKLVPYLGALPNGGNKPLPKHALDSELQGGSRRQRHGQSDRARMGVNLGLPSQQTTSNPPIPTKNFQPCATQHFHNESKPLTRGPMPIASNSTFQLTALP